MRLKRHFHGEIWIALVFAVLTVLPFFSCDLIRKDALVLASFIFNAVVIVIGLVITQKKYPFSIEMMVWVFLFFFMYFAPMYQYLSDYFPWDGKLTDTECLSANLLITLFIFCFTLGKLLSKKMTSKSKTNFLTSPISYRKGAQWVVTLVSVILAVYSLGKTGIEGIVVSRDEATEVFYSGGYSNSNGLRLVVEAVVPGFLAYAAAEAAQDFAKGKRVRFIIQLLCLAVCFFPTAVARYKMASMYLSILIVMFPALKRKNRFFWLFVSALFFIFPVLSGFRAELDWSEFGRFFTKFKTYYINADYDAYRMLVSVIRYINKYEIVWGRQLLGVLLFFVPRALWPNKPKGSGVLIILSELGADAFSNVSCPFIGEGLINFGIFGVIAFALLMGALAQSCDAKYWAIRADNTPFSSYLILMLMIFFVMRGDLLSSFAYTVGFLVTGQLLKWLFGTKPTPTPTLGE